MTTNAYLVYWCSEGLESVVPITEYEHIDSENTFRILNDQEPVRNPLTGVIQRLTLRAHVNSQRSYELYAVEAAAGITENDIRSMFDANPQTAADTCRRIGVKMYGTPAGTNKVVIT